MITDEKSIHKLPHNIIMEDRKKLSVSGVTDIDSFDEQTIIAITDLGEICTSQDLILNRVS